MKARNASTRSYPISLLPVNVLENLIAANQMDPYDSDSSDGPSEFPVRSTVPEPLPVDDANYETYKHSQQFLIVDHTWNNEYLIPAKAKEARSQLLDSEPPKKKQFTFRYWQQTHDPAKTEFENYADGTPDKDSNSFNGITWWAGMSGKDDFPTLFQYALDTLSCPAMSAECERVFSSAKKLITPERNQLGEDIIEACECLKAWWRNSPIEQQFGH